MKVNFIALKLRAASNGAGSRRDIVLALVIILVGCGSFGLGRLSKITEQQMPLAILNTAETAMAQEGIAKRTAVLETLASPAESGQFVASRNGSAYYLPSCSGVKQIKEENKIWFATAEEARLSGYRPAANCKGL